jgi:hypothetical protein
MTKNSDQKVLDKNQVKENNFEQVENIKQKSLLAKAVDSIKSVVIPVVIAILFAPLVLGIIAYIAYKVITGKGKTWQTAKSVYKKVKLFYSKFS